MEKINGRPGDLVRFSPFVPVQVLYEFDGARIFTIVDSEGELHLAYWSDQDDHCTRFVVVPTTPRIVEALQAGNISVYEALRQARCWLCEVSHQGEVLRCVRVEFDDIAEDTLPARRTLLWPSLERLGSPQPTTIDLEGRIRELDKDRLSFDLREITGRSLSQRFVFDAELLADVVEAFRDDVRVRVAGRSVAEQDLLFAAALSRVEDGSS
jgi:hypothetical protein